jgi:DNA-binding NtrC family response regulator
MTNDDKARILIADDEQLVRRTIADYLVKLGKRVDSVGNGLDALERLSEYHYDLALFDVKMPGLDGLTLLDRAQALRPELSIVIMTGHGTMEMVIEALRLGAVDFLNKPVRLGELDAVLQKAERIGELRRDRTRLREAIRFIQSSEDVQFGKRRLIGGSPATESVRNQVRLAVEAECDTILIVGETGTGKEVVAREIHNIGGPTDSPFIAVSCPALPESLVESELFGHVKGSFTGALENRAGHFELADGGTLFLDEIADLSAAAQAKILRALETRRIRRVGSSRECTVNLRVVAATNAPLEELVEERKFRRDLLYRLNGFSIPLAPLRERREDILPLANHFLNTFAAKRNMRLLGLSDDAQEALKHFDFPGNTRQLKNVVERAAILRGEGQIQVQDLALPESPEGSGPDSDPPSKEDWERRRILLTLERVRWNRREAAKVLEIPYSTLRYKIKMYGIE